MILQTRRWLPNRELIVVADSAFAALEWLHLFSLVTLLADRLVNQGTLPLPRDAWYAKQRPTFADALAAVRQQYWAHMGFRVSGRKRHILKSAKALRDCLIYALCRAA